MPADYKTLGVPAGVLMGVLAVRGLLPEKYRNWKTYGAGAGVGGVAGHVGGGYLDALAPEPAKILGGERQSDVLKRKLRNMASTLAGKGATHADKAKAILDVTGQKGYDTGMGKALVSPTEYHSLDTEGAVKNLHRSRMSALADLINSRIHSVSGDAAAAEKAQKHHDTRTQRLKNWSGRSDEEFGLLDPLAIPRNMIVYGGRSAIELGNRILKSPALFGKPDPIDE